MKVITIIEFAQNNIMIRVLRQCGSNAFYHKLAMLIIMLVLASNAYSSEKVITTKQNSLRSYNQYPLALLKLALLATEEEYGKAEVDHTEFRMTRKRRLNELLIGENLHVAAQATSLTWEQQAIPIYIPIQKGILGYRVFLIKKSNSELLASISTLEKLREISTGAGEHWAIARIFKANDFNLMTSVSIDSLYLMLQEERFLTYSRGIHEISREYNQSKDQYSDLMIDQHIALFTFLPKYFFVSPKKPQLAERISKGLLKLMEDGSFEKLFLEYYQPLLDSVKLENRKVFTIHNPELSDKTPNNIKYWYQPMPNK